MEASTRLSFGQWLHQQRRKRGLTQQHLAQQAGLGRPHISRLENGEAQPRRSTVRALTAALGITDQSEIAHAEALAGYARAGQGDPDPERVRAALESLARDSVGRQVLARLQDALRATAAGSGDALRPDDQVSRINAAYRYARFTLRATGGGYDLEIRPPADDLDREGLDDRLAFVRTIERQHDLKLLPDDIQ